MASTAHIYSRIHCGVFAAHKKMISVNEYEVKDGEAKKKLVANFPHSPIRTNSHKQDESRTFCWLLRAFVRTYVLGKALCLISYTVLPNNVHYIQCRSRFGVCVVGVSACVRVLVGALYLYDNK